MFKDCKSLLELIINNNLEYMEDNENFDMNNYELENNENNIIVGKMKKQILINHLNFMGIME